ncbi:MAG: hypothetical protein EOO85_27245 [Pedobacter sp.]|nr:MAG: hypothetical protein EOO85_27245 [Pedobacter sp.]
MITENGMDELCNCKLHYPKNASERKLEDLHRAQEEFDSFLKKVMTAFELPLKNDDNKKVNI